MKYADFPETPEDFDVFYEKCLEALFEKDRLAYLGHFLKGLIHNINGPLQNISMLLEILIRGLDAQDAFMRSHCKTDTEEWDELMLKQRTRFTHLHQQIAGVAQMLRDFMVIYEVERKGTELELNLVLTKLTNVFRADLFFKHQVELDLRLTKNLPMLHIPGRCLIPVLIHLIRNALVAMRGAQRKKLTIESLAMDGKVAVVFKDTGCGSSGNEEMWSGLFYSMWENPMPEGEEEKHSGFGLFAVERLLEPYGGKIRFEREEEGTRVILEIPVNRR